MTKISPQERRNIRNGLLFISPWLVGFLGLNAYPIVASFWYSLTNYSALGAAQFVGLHNYTTLFTQDPYFLKSLANTVYMVVIGLPAGVVVGVGIALLLNLRVRGQGFFRTAFFLPSIMPTLGATLLFLWIFNPQYGLMDQALRAVGLPAPGWFVSVAWAKPALILLGLWGSGNAMVIYLANLQGVPRTLYDAAAVDGAGSFRKFWNITLPMITPSIFFNVVMGLIGTFQYFTQAFVATGGGPYNSTLFYALYLFEQAFTNFNFGYASAMAWVLFVLVLIITLILFKTAWRWVFYAGEN